MFGPGMRRRYSAVGAVAEPSMTPPNCSTGDAMPLYRMLTDLGFYLGPFESHPNLTLMDAACRFAKSVGLPHVCTQGIDALFCQALLAAWQQKTSPKRIDPALLKAAGVRFRTTPGAENGAVEATDPISDCHLVGGSWDPVAMTCVMAPAGMAPATKYLIIGGVLLAVGVAGYGIYAATR
jgi:hypothetical protein